METLYKYFRWLSLDIVTGAIFLLAYLGSIYQITFSFSTYFGLSSAIWLIYTTDHLIDARKVSSPSSGRHLFHKKNFRMLVVMAGVVLMMGFINIYFLPAAIVRNGAILSAICVGYLLIVFLYKRMWIKEALVALAYASGIFLAPVTLKEQLVWMDFILFLQVVLVAFINLLVFSYYDIAKDQRDGFNSFVMRLGKRNASVCIHLLGLVSIGFSGILYILYESEVQQLFLIMSSILYLVFLVPKAANQERFRIIGDGIFFLPVLFLF